jgi:hypothetical protein
MAGWDGASREFGAPLGAAGSQLSPFPWAGLLEAGGLRECGEPEGCGDLKGWLPLLRSHQPSAQRIQQLESPEVSIGWPEVEEVRDGLGCVRWLALALALGLLSKVQQGGYGYTSS